MAKRRKHELIQKVNLKGEVVGTYQSAKEAAYSNGINSVQQVYNSINYRRRSLGFYYVSKDMDYRRSIKTLYENINKEFSRLYSLRNKSENNNVLMSIYFNIAEKYNLSTGHIRRIIKGY